MAGYNNFIGYGYPNNYPATNSGFQPYQQQVNYQQAQQPRGGIEWVDGEVGAKAFQLPTGWPANVPMPLWDTNDTVIYLKSVNAMGMPNPLQKVHYTMEQNQSTLPSAGESVMIGQSAHAADMSNYVTKDDFDKFRDEFKAAINSLKEMKWNGKSSV